MATTVLGAVEEFLRDCVNLEPDDVGKARASAEWLLTQIASFPTKFDDFPELWTGYDIAFGSFARRTKVRPLDDVDLISGMHAKGATYIEHSFDNVEITVKGESRLAGFCNPGTTNLNSRMIVNRYVKALSQVGQYRRAEVNRRSEAATLQLVSYDWNFDIVPAFMTSQDQFGRTYYLIPNGEGRWKKTDPRIDRDRVSAVDARHNGNMLNVIRTVKYWQRRRTMPTMASYLLECMLVEYFDERIDIASKYVDLEMSAALTAVANKVLTAVHDPKGISPDLNDLSWDDRVAIRARALLDAQRSVQANAAEDRRDMRQAILLWRQVFGDDFPEYG